MTEPDSKTISLFRDINADDEDPEVTELESLCLNCHEHVCRASNIFVMSSISFLKIIMYQRVFAMNKVPKSLPTREIFRPEG